MTRRDLVVLAADKDMEHALRGLLSRHKSLPIRRSRSTSSYTRSMMPLAQRVAFRSFPRSPSDTNTHC